MPEIVNRFAQERRRYHLSLLRSILYADGKGVPSNADKDSIASVKFAKAILGILHLEVAQEDRVGQETRLSGQSAGRKFETLTAEFLDRTFALLGHLRPGDWQVVDGTGPT